MGNIQERNRENRIESAEMAQGGIEPAEIEQGEIEPAKITQDGIKPAEMAQEGIEQGEIEWNRIEQTEMAQEGIESVEVAQDRIGQAKIEQEGIGSAEMAQDGIEPDEMEQKRLKQEEMPQGEIGQSGIAQDDIERQVQKQMAMIKKGVLELIQEDELEQKLRRSITEQKPLTIKLGLDPSAPDIHLGHTVVLRKVRQMQEFGHQAVIIIGDFTGKIGDPTGRSKTRRQLTKEQVEENAATYMEQIFKVLDREKTQVCFNSEWLAKLDFEAVIRLAASTTVARLLEREDFANRYRRQEPIGLHEFFYPLMQAYDSVQIGADIEIGGTDQTFNILMGRTLQKTLGKEPQAAVFMPLLEGLDGVEKMSKSLGNYIGVDEEPQVMFKKVMEVPDGLVLRYFELVTDVSPEEIEKLADRLAAGENPRDIKLLLAGEITALYHGAEQAKKAEEYFLSVFSAGQLPKEMKHICCRNGEQTLLDIVPYLIENKIVVSGSEFRRLVKQGGVSMNGTRVTDPGAALDGRESVLKIGKKQFICFEREN